MYAYRARTLSICTGKKRSWAHGGGREKGYLFTRKKNIEQHCSLCWTGVCVCVFVYGLIWGVALDCLGCILVVFFFLTKRGEKHMQSSPNVETWFLDGDLSFSFLSSFCRFRSSTRYSWCDHRARTLNLKRGEKKSGSNMNNNNNNNKIGYGE